MAAPHARAAYDQTFFVPLVDDLLHRHAADQARHVELVAAGEEDGGRLLYLFDCFIRERVLSARHVNYPHVRDSQLTERGFVTGAGLLGLVGRHRHHDDARPSPARVLHEFFEDSAVTFAVYGAVDDD